MNAAKLTQARYTTCDFAGTALHQRSPLNDANQHGGNRDDQQNVNEATEGDFAERCELWGRVCRFVDSTHRESPRWLDMTSVRGHSSNL
jgi:hypothetical protein